MYLLLQVTDGRPHKLLTMKSQHDDEHAIILTNDNKAYGWGLTATVR